MKIDVSSFLQEILNISALKSVLQVLLVLVLTWIALTMAKRFSMGLVRFVARQKDDEEFQKRTRTLGDILRYVIIVLATLAVTTMTVLKEPGIDIGPVLAAAGIVGLAVGFGAQSLAKDIISGFLSSLKIR